MRGLTVVGRREPLEEVVRHGRRGDDRADDWGMVVDLVLRGMSSGAVACCREGGAAD